MFVDYFYQELTARKEELQAAIRREAELMERYKEQLLKYPPRSETPATSDEESVSIYYMHAYVPGVGEILLLAFAKREFFQIQ